MADFGPGGPSLAPPAVTKPLLAYPIASLHPCVHTERSVISVCLATSRRGGAARRRGGHAHNPGTDDVSAASAAAPQFICERRRRLRQRPALPPDSESAPGSDHRPSTSQHEPCGTTIAPGTGHSRPPPPSARSASAPLRPSLLAHRRCPDRLSKQ